MEYNGRIELNYFKGFYGKDASEETKTKENVRKIVQQCCDNLTFERIDFFNMEETPNTYDAGSIKKLVFFVNTTGKNAAAEGKFTCETGIVIGGKERKFKTFFQPNTDNSHLVASENGVAIAQYYPGNFQINILFDLFEQFDEDMLDVTRYIMSAVNKLIPDLIDAPKKWNIEENKPRLLKTFEQEVVKLKEEQLKRDREQVTRYEQDLKYFREQLMVNERKRIALMRSIEAVKNEGKDEMQTIANDFDLIEKHEKITSLMIDRNLVTVKTVPLIITSDKGKRYYGGEYTVTIDMKNSDVRFKGGTPRNSYWTNYDPHPHVNGKDGRACLGNVAETIAELCAGFQIYALVMICIDFLEAANTSDAAGKKVVNWDEIDESGKILEKKEATNLFACACCEGMFDEDDLCLVYEDEEEDDDGIHAVGDHMVCEECRNNMYHYSNDTEEYIRD